MLLFEEQATFYIYVKLKKVKVILLICELLPDDNSNSLKV